MSAPRYAIYYVPPAESDLYKFGAGLLGYDLFSGASLSVSVGVEAAVPDWRELSRGPRLYGFHATLKAPFFLAPGIDEDDLRDASGRFAATARAIPLIRPVVDAVGDFVAVVPAQASPPLDRLAADCVRSLDSLRAPLTSADRARRDPASLTARQADYLDRWGYPYVMEDFRFHLTLTGRLARERQAPLVAMLRKRFSALGLRDLPVDRIALLRQDAGGAAFRALACWPLRDYGGF